MISFLMEIHINGSLKALAAAEVDDQSDLI